MPEIITIPTIEQYYNQKDSVYLRIEFVPEMGFRITMRNELLLSQDADIKSGEFIGAIARGLLEIGYRSGQEIYTMGMKAAYLDMLEASTKDMNDEQKKVWLDMENINRSIN